MSTAPLPTPLPVAVLKAALVVIDKKPRPGLDGAYLDGVAAVYVTDGHMGVAIELGRADHARPVAWLTKAALVEAVAVARARKVDVIDVVCETPERDAFPLAGLRDFVRDTAHVESLPDNDEDRAAWRNEGGTSPLCTGYGVSVLRKALDVADLLGGVDVGTRVIETRPHGRHASWRVIGTIPSIASVRCVVMTRLLP